VVPASPEDLVHELRLHEIELEMQNEELLLHKLELELQNEELRGFHQGLDATRHRVDVLVAVGIAELQETVRRLSEEVVAHRQAEHGLHQARAEQERQQARLQAENAYLRQEVERYQGPCVRPSEHLLLARLLPQIEQAAAGDHPVLVVGETGVGKKGVVRAIHQRGARRNRSMVSVECTLLPAELLDCTLFGRDRGPAPDGRAPWLGRLELAEQSDLFLNEVGALPMDVRARLLDALRNRRFHPQDGERVVSLGARILAATSRNLEDLGREGRLQDDLVADLELQVLHVPPLRERREDIPALAEIFVAWYNRKHCRAVERIPEATLDRWMGQDWPCNVRELRFTVERAVVRSSGSRLEP
jgi:DNA-binding NtrC family response regulator